MNPADLGGNNGSVVGFISEPFGLPDHLPGLFVEGHDRSLGSTWSCDDLVPVHQGRLAKAPLRHDSAEIIHKMPGPFDLPIAGSHTDQLAVMIDSIDPIAVHRRCAPGAGKHVARGRVTD